MAKQVGGEHHVQGAKSVTQAVAIAARATLLALREVEGIDPALRQRLSEFADGLGQFLLPHEGEPTHQ